MLRYSDFVPGQVFEVIAYDQDSTTQLTNQAFCLGNRYVVVSAQVAPTIESEKRGKLVWLDLVSGTPPDPDPDRSHQRMEFFIYSEGEDTIDKDYERFATCLRVVCPFEDGTWLRARQNFRAADGTVVEAGERLWFYLPVAVEEARLLINRTPLWADLSIPRHRFPDLPRLLAPADGASYRWPRLTVGGWERETFGAGISHDAPGDEPDQDPNSDAVMAVLEESGNVVVETAPQIKQAAVPPIIRYHEASRRGTPGRVAVTDPRQPEAAFDSSEDDDESRELSI